MTTPDTLDEDVAAVRARVDTAARVAHERKAELRLAELDLERHLASLKAEFGVETLEEARALLAELDGELRDEVARVVEQLEVAEGGGS